MSVRGEIVPSKIYFEARNVAVISAASTSFYMNLMHIPPSSRLSGVQAPDLSYSILVS